MSRRIDTPVLGGGRGHLSDWLTQRWVEWAGRRVVFDDAPWLRGRSGGVGEIGAGFFERAAATEGLRCDDTSPRRGLLDDFATLAGPGFDVARVHPEVVRFYEDTAAYELDVWSQWAAPFRPFGEILAALFSRRLQQLNVPLTPLDASLGVTNRVIKLRDPSGAIRETAWVRTLVATGNTLYAGSYGVCSVPAEPGPCMRVAFPLPNGSAIVVMRPHANEDGSLEVASVGDAYGSAGFYFFVSDGAGGGWARYVRALRETIRVYVDASGVARADHVLNLFGAPFLRLHYRMRRRAGA
jgi:hypothetical protein